MGNGNDGGGESGQGGGDEGEETDGDSDADLVNYRGQIPQSDWEEFKQNVPRTIKLPEKINELIRRFNASQRENETENGPNNQGR